ncbi:hypothetical protein E1B28_003813 [Marasmius oreades]|uniref:O-methyltransferase domain-containing protein n=1 Tax=Marasmius oreades TaxID=181124 RepID=A0A9P7UXA5_9AGAR|nr:uncharacterized protein E1B28_003813 [Marasmius oreades]KAG7096369.1 hypothetical protein E1B28_003813 [Marasmius oreades]
MTIPTLTGDPDIDSLLGLIHSATRIAVAEYRKSGYGVPSPNDSNPHPLDTASDVLALKKAVRVLEGACERICTTLAQPMHTVANRSMAYEAPCLRLAAEQGVADILEGYPQGLHIDRIAAKTKLDASKLRQVLRLLATRGCFKEVDENVFANNRLSCTLLSSNPVSATVLLTTGECLRAVNALPEALVDPDYAYSGAVNKTAFTYSVRGDMENAALFDWYKANRFDRAMMGWSMITGSIAMVNNFPWEKMAPGTTLCDIGSGVGTIPLSIAKAHAHVRITLQDLPEPLEQAKYVWSREFPGGLDNERVQFVPLDFLKGMPVVGQDIYYMKHVLHDWPDSEAITIIDHIASAMTLQSRLLIHDFVLKHMHSESKHPESSHIRIERAPYPLLPNYGTGNIRNYTQDVNMLAVFNSRERTCEEYSALGAAAGLELVKVWDFAETYMLEFRLNAKVIASAVVPRSNVRI